MISGSRDIINTQSRFIHLMSEGQGVLRSETMQNHSDSFLSHLCLGEKTSSCIRYEKRNQMKGIQEIISGIYFFFFFEDTLRIATRPYRANSIYTWKYISYL